MVRPPAPPTGPEDDGRAVATHRVQRRPDRPAPIRDARRDPGTQMRRPRAGARRCTRPFPVRSERMWSLPISPAAAYILLINSLRREKGSVDSWSACWSGATEGARTVPAAAVDRAPRGRSVSVVKRGWMVASDKKTDEVQHFLNDHNHRWPRWTKRCRFGFAACSHDFSPEHSLVCLCAWPIVFVVLRRAVRRLSVSACGYGSLLVYAR